MKRIKKHDLTAWFLQDHRTLPVSYVKSCEKFFRELGEKRGKLQATSDEPQAASVKRSNLFIEMLNKKG
jgi:predicted lactoylglutathione lyase